MIYLVTYNMNQAVALNNKEGLDGQYVSHVGHLLELARKDVVVLGKEWKNRTDAGAISIILEHTNATVIEA